MPALNWIGKEAVIGHHERVPYRLLRCDRVVAALVEAAAELAGVMAGGGFVDSDLWGGGGPVVGWW